MNIKIIKLLSAACAALMVLLMTEWIAAKYALNYLMDSERPVSSQSYQIDDIPSIDLTGKSEELYSDMVSRPLFIQGRRPVAEVTPEQANAVPGSETFDWQLIGIYTVKNSLTALFSREKNPVDKDNYRKLKVNGDLDGWKLTEIQKDKVILVQPGSEPKPLTLRKPKPKELPQTQAQEPVPNQAPARSQIHRRTNPPRPSEPEEPEEPQVSEEASENSDNEE